MPLIDAHQHFWTVGAPWHCWPGPELPSLYQDFLPPDIAPLLDAEEVIGTVLVQSQPSSADTDWMLDIASVQPRILGVVGWIDLVDPDAPARIAALARRAKLKGLRPMLQDLPADWVEQPAAAPALTAIAEHGLVLDALIRPAHLRSIEAIARRYPALSIVVDHIAKPDIAGDVRQPWASDLSCLAALPQVSCKLSGLVTEAATCCDARDLQFYVETAVSLFGPDRLLWGSDWPVVLLRTSYADWLDTARTLLPPQDRHAILYENAIRIYGLELPPRPA